MSRRRTCARLAVELRALHRADLRRALIAGCRALFLAEAERLRQGPHSTLAVVVASYCDGAAAELAIAALTHPHVDADHG